MFCAQCGKENPGHARFCFACGNPLTLPTRVSSGTSVRRSDDAGQAKQTSKNPYLQWWKGQPKAWWVGAVAGFLVVVIVLTFVGMAYDVTFYGGGWAFIGIFGGGWIAEQIASRLRQRRQRENPMLKSYVVYTVIMWLLAMGCGFLFGYAQVPFGQLWTQVALIVVGYLVWKSIVTKLIAAGPGRAIEQ